ncbi:B-box zinc finger protein [Edaphobacter bradus]|uniref:B-box zinc finger protein n=1 Tax=Edaphobacter bradus TaxID=2259016 RepID=UPI0021E0E64E|nr:B-box zinc finger protein [Edaphobacter bradus]
MNCANHPDRERIAFCQNCGKPLCQECARTVGSAVFCEPCLAARLSGVGAPPPASAGTYANAGGAPNLSYSTAGAIPPPGGPNPVLAALLGVIPGVGAMYNGQYAKGVVHLIVFAVLVSIAEQHDIFGLFVFGWMVYQVIEAYHTAKARRDGTPLPNPFGLNDLGERLGFGKSWPSAVATSGPMQQPPPAEPVVPPPAAASAVPPPPGGYNYTYNYPPPAASWSAPWDSQANPYAATQPQPLDPNAPLYPPRSRFPTGAIWLIGLGLLFLIGNSGFFHVFHLVPFFLIGLGVWIFIHRMTLSGEGLADDGTAYYRIRLLSALRGSIWVILVGVMFLLASFNILSWGKSWPLFIIVAGLMIFFERAAYSSAAASPPLYPPPPPAAPAPPAPPTSTTPIVPTEHDQEGR